MNRRKSCAECVKAKRKCDLERPSCRRCNKQRLSCEYDSAHPPSKKQRTNAPGSDVDTTAWIESVLPDLGLSLLDPLLDSSEGLLELPISVESFDSATMVPPDTDRQVLRPVHLSIEPLTSENLPFIIKHRMAFVIEQLQRIPMLFATEVGIPWCHPLLYDADMPSVIREVQAACALYAVLNTVNARSIWGNIEGRAEYLFATKQPTEPAELLAYIQAMLLYQIMRFFGGSFAERAKADRSMQRLEDAAYALYSMLDLNDAPRATVAIYPTTASTAFWKSWIVLESQRRTHIACIVFISICSLLQARLDYCSHQTSLDSLWTASAHLWTASNVLDFTLAWQQKRHYMVRQHDFAEIIADANPDDLELFGRMLMSGFMGVDNFKGWLHSRGGTW